MTNELKLSSYSSLCSSLIFFHFRPNVFFVVARLTSDNCNPPLLVCVCFSVCVEALRWTDYREICRMLYASLEHMAMWDNVCDNGVFLLQNTQTCTHMARHQTRTSCLKKKIDIGRKGFWPMNFNDFAKHIDVVL